MDFRDKDPIISFNPDGDGYDYGIATSDGSAFDVNATKVIDDRTGMILVGKNNPNWKKALEEETQSGNTISKADDGRYYSTKMPKFFSDPIIGEPRVKDTAENVLEQAKIDYKFAMDFKETLGGVEAIKKNWLTESGIKTNIPFIGGLLGASKKSELIDSIERIKNPSLYEKNWDSYTAESTPKSTSFYGIEVSTKTYKTTAEEMLDLQRLSAIQGGKEKYIEKMKQIDKDRIEKHFEYLNTNKSYMYKVLDNASRLPSIMVEFFATGGLASAGSATTKMMAEKILGKLAISSAGKLALKTAGWSGGAIARSAGLGSNTLDTMSQRRLDIVMGLKENENWATSAMIAWGDTVIEAASESAGEGITSIGKYSLDRLPFGSKVTSALESAWIKVTGGNKGEFARKILSTGGYSNIIGEIGEERLGTLLRAITDVDDFGLGKDASMIDRIKAGITQDIENIGVEVGVLAIPAGGQVALGQLLNIGKQKPDFDSTIFDQTSKEAISEVSNEIIADATKEVAPNGKTADNTVIKPTAKPMEATKQVDGTNAAIEQPKTVIRLVTIETANTSKEINQVVEQIITQGIGFNTSARQVDLNEFREALHLDGISSKERISFQQTLQRAKDLNIIADAMNIAAQVNSGVKHIDIYEKAGLVMKAAQIKYQHKLLEQDMDKATDKVDIDSIGAKQDILQKEFDVLTTALFAEGSTAGRLLNSQKLTINQNFDLVSLRNRAKKQKGRELTEKENEKITQLSKDLEMQKSLNDALQKRIDESTAKQFVRQGSIAKFSKMSRSDIDSQLNSLIGRTKQLLEEGCFN